MATSETGRIPDGGMDFEPEIAPLREALIRQREYTLALYADLPDAYWEPAKFPYMPIVNPPLWELAHIAWFAEFFCLRWRPDDPSGQSTHCLLSVGDSLFNSQTVPHRERWLNRYPDKEACFRYMQDSQSAVIEALEASDAAGREGFQLSVAHEDMHAEALAMTLGTLGLPLPACVPSRRIMVNTAADTIFEGGDFSIGASSRALRFDNEMPALALRLAPFSISSRPVSAAEFAEFSESPDYADDRFWSAEGSEWRRQVSPRPVRADQKYAAMHISYFEAEAWCRWAGRRLPSEAEWEFAATQSAGFRASTGHVWEWTASPFAPFAGFVPGRYRDYSAPWFYTHQVLKGGSFVTHGRLKYPQYRNFYTKGRRDVFCGFRTCANT